jgi:hypothetical protein
MTMDFEAMSDAWRREGAGPASDPRQELETVRARAAGLRRAVRRRDWTETGVALVLLPIFVLLAVKTAQPLSAIGAAIVAAACVLIPVRLKLARPATIDRSGPVTQVLRAELAAIDAQERLLRGVAWWYFSPIGAGVILFMFGAPVPLAFKILYGGVVVALFLWLIELNRRAVRRVLRPMARQLEISLAEFAESSDEGADNAQ